MGTLQWPELLEILRCALCREQLRPPVFQCPKGHTGCERCYLAEEVCVCGGKLGSRNYAAETLLEALEGECQHCATAITYSETSTHARTCANRLYPCPLCHGYVFFPPSELLTHLLGHSFRRGINLSNQFMVEMRLSPMRPEDGIHATLPGQLRILLKVFIVKGDAYVTALIMGVEEAGVKICAETEGFMTPEVMKTLRAGEQTVLFRIQSYSWQTFRLMVWVFPKDTERTVISLLP